MQNFRGIRRLLRLDRGVTDVQRDVDDELQFHFDQAIQDLVAAGRSPEDARREAEARFGDRFAARRRLAELDRHRLESERRAERWESVWQDIRYAVRALTRAPGFALAAILTLGIGIGANTAIFSVVSGVLLRASPFSGLDRVVMVWETDRNSGTTREPASIPDYRDFRARARAFERLAAFTPFEITIARAGSDPERVAGLAVSKDYVATVGLPVMVGRSFTDEEDRAGGPRAVIIGEDLWDREFGRNPDLTGKTLILNDNPWSVVGVMRRDADFGVLQVLGLAAYQRGFADRGGRTRVDLWAPLRPSDTAPRGNHPIFVVGRLGAGVSPVAAQREMTAITADLEREYAHDNAGRGAFVERMEDVVFGGVRTSMYVLLGAVALVLLVACANVANLLLVRATARAREVLVRAALGASVARLRQQFVVEALLLCGLGAAVGLMVANGAVGALRALAPATIPRADQIGVDGAALALTAAVACGLALVFGLIPARLAGKLELDQSLHAEGARGASSGTARRSLRSMLVVGELAAATTLMIGAGLLIRSLWELHAVDPGFDARGVLKAEFQLPASRYPRDFSVFPTWPAAQTFQAEALSRLAALPGVESAALATANPMDAGFTSSIRVVGREAEADGWPEPSIRTVSTGYFAALRVAQVDGRGFDGTDLATSTPVIVINTAARGRYFEGRAALGAQIRLWGSDRTVIGVVGNERFKGLAVATPPAVYLPLTQLPGPGALFVRVRGGDEAAAAIAPLVRAAIKSVDAALPLSGMEPLSRTVSGTLGQRRYSMLVLTAFAFAAVLLAVIGVYGVLSYAVAQRTREIGVRVALGADTSRVTALVLGDGARLVGIGLAIGLLAALALSQVMGSLLFGVTARDPATFGGVSLLLAIVALVSCWLPARRASRVDPTIALRSD